MGDCDCPVRGTASPSQARCCKAPLPGKAGGRSSKGALADEAFQLWNEVEALLEERVDRKRLAEGGECLARLVLLDADEADACKRTEVPGLQHQHSVTVSERTVVFANEIE